MGNDTPHSAEDLAYLAGGPLRLAEAVLAVLVAGGRVRVSGEGRLYPVITDGTTKPPTTQTERATLAAIGMGGRPAAAVLREVARSAGPEVTRARLCASGLVRRPPRRPRRTAEGEAVLAAAHRTADPSAGVLVALGGLEAYPDDAVGLALATSKAKDQANAHAGSGGGTSGCCDGISCGAPHHSGGGGGGGAGPGCGGGGCGGGCGGGGS